jgi:putative membrane protein
MKFLSTMSIVPALLLGTAALSAEITPADFAAKVASSDSFEIQAGELALQKATSDKAKAFAEDMIKHHKQSTASLMAAAKEAGITIDAKLSPELQTKLENLKATSGPTFDAAYLSTQVSAHTAAVELFGNFAEHGEGGPLKAFAVKTFPVIRSHLVRVRAMHTEE